MSANHSSAAGRAIDPTASVASSAASGADRRWVRHRQPSRRGSDDATHPPPPNGVQRQSRTDARSADRRGRHGSDLVVGGDEESEHQQRHGGHHVRREAGLRGLGCSLVEVGGALTQQHRGPIDRRRRRSTDPARRGDHGEGKSEMRAGVVDTIDGSIDRQAALDRQAKWCGGLLGRAVDRKHGDGVAQRRPRSNAAGDVVAPGGNGSGPRWATSCTVQPPGLGETDEAPGCTSGSSWSTPRVRA